MPKVLFVSSEVYPLIKTGGLADVAGALPVTLKGMRCNVRIMLPAYPAVLQSLKKIKQVSDLYIPGTPGKVKILESTLPGSNVKLILLDYPAAFQRSGNPYLDSSGQAWPDNAERFSLLCKTVVIVARNLAGLNWQPDIVHCNDWQTGLVAPLLFHAPNRPAMVFTIHNLSYQGRFSYSVFESLGLPQNLWNHNALEFHGDVSFIKGGLVFSDRINTVSPQYAQEIQSHEFGCGLEGLLHYRQNALSGILNGIDTNTWNPASDPHIAANYDMASLEQKKTNKTELQKCFGLPQSPALLIGFVGRLVEQKGIDLIISAAAEMAAKNLQLVVLGTGDKRLEAQLKQLAQQHTDNIAVNIGYNEVLAHKIEAGSDAFLMPSRFEPCGLNQMYSLRYASLPIVTRVGGLADTVVDATPQSIKDKVATGFIIEDFSSKALISAIVRANDLFQHQATWQSIMQNAMQQQYDWKKSAKQYLKLYELAISTKQSLTGAPGNPTLLASG